MCQQFVQMGYRYIEIEVYVPRDIDTLSNNEWRNN